MARKESCSSRNSALQQSATTLFTENMSRPSRLPYSYTLHLCLPGLLLVLMGIVAETCSGRGVCQPKVSFWGRH